MAISRKTTVGVFDEPSLADNAVSALENAGFSSDQIYYSGHHASSGGFLAGLKSLFTGDDTASGSVKDDFAGMGFSDDETRHYESEYQAGRALVAVQASGREQEAATILQTNGAQTYGSRVGDTQPAYGTTGVDTSRTVDDTQPAYGTTGVDTSRTVDDTSDTQRNIRLREEQLNVGKQTVQTGEVGLHKDIISEQKNIDVPVQHEEVYIERRPVADGQIDDATPIGQDESFRVPVSEEQVNVSKDTVVTGEVAVGKRTVQGTQRVSDTVKREQLKVDQQGDVPVNDVTNEQ